MVTNINWRVCEGFTSMHLEDDAAILGLKTCGQSLPQAA